MKNKTYLMFALIIAALISPIVMAAQTCNSAIPLTRPDNRYTLNGDGTATDNITGLVWMRCSLGQTWDSVNSTCSGTASTHTWSAALTTAESYSFATFTDWRLPNIKELTSITEKACYSPAINLGVFPATTSHFYWSSSPSANANASSNGRAWYNSFGGYGDGQTGKSNSRRVRLVRAGQ